jgi:dihydropteroate synthase
MAVSYRLMGIVNVTPDSFSDGGEFLDADAAIAHARLLAEEGAHILDVGGESTRPGAQPVSLEEELRRVLPVVDGVAAAMQSMHARPQISIDTSKAAVARAALAAGASLVNDVSAFRADPEMAAVVAESGADCCLMHMRGEPPTMQDDPRYEDVVDDVRAFLEERLAFAVGAGVERERIMLDPGIGFGKTERHNLELLRRLEELTSLGAPIVIGTSRKGFLGDVMARATGRPEPVDVADRLPGTIASNVLAYERGASVFRVHDVAPVRDALAVAAATLGERWTARSTGTTPAG